MYMHMHMSCDERLAGRRTRGPRVLPCSRAPVLPCGAPAPVRARRRLTRGRPLCPPVGSQLEIEEYRVTVQSMLRTAAKDAVRPMTASLRRQASSLKRPTTRDMKAAAAGERPTGRNGGRRGRKVAPEEGAAAGGAGGGSGRKKKGGDETLQLEDIAEEEAGSSPKAPKPGKAVKSKPPNNYSGPAWPKDST